MIEQIVTTLGQIGIFSAAAYFIKEYITKNSAREIEQYKNELKMLSDNHSLTLSNELEKYKAELEININKQGKLYEKHLLVIDEAHKKMCELDLALQYKVLSVLEDNPEVSKTKNQTILERYQEFAMYFRLNRHYFKIKHADLIQNLLTECAKMAIEFTMIEKFPYYRQLVIEKKDSFGLGFTKAENMIKDELPTIIKAIEDEFRKLMGVEY